MNSLEETKKCERAAADIKMITSVHLAVLEKQLVLKKENGYSAKCNCSTLFNKATLKMVFDAVHHSVEYSSNVSEMELFRDELLDAVHNLSCLINVWKEGEEKKDTVSHVDFTQP